MADAVLEARKGRGLEPEPSSRPQLDTAKGALPQVSRENLYQQNCCEPLTEKGAAHKLNGLNLLSRDPDRLNSIEELGRFKELGYKVLIAPDGFVTGQDHADIFSDVAAKAGIKREPINAKDARSALQTEHGSDRELPPSLGSQEGKVIYRPYAFRSYEIGGNKALVQVLSELPGKGQSILLQKRIPLKGGKIEGEAMEELAGELAETLKRKQTDLEKIAIQARPDLVPGTPFAAFPLKDRAADPEATKALLSLAKQGPIEIEILPSNPQVESVSGRDGSEDSITLTLTPEKIASLNGHPLAINGRILAILHEKDRSPTTQPAGTSREIRENIDSRWTDRHGNIHTLMYEADDSIKKLQVNDGDEPRYHFILPHVAPLIGDRGEATKWSPVNLDFSRDGAEIAGIFYAAPEIPLARQGVYDVFTNLPADLVKQHLSKHFPDLERGTKHAETLFGYSAGEIVKHFNIINSRQPNAFYQESNRNSTVFLDELFFGSDPIKDVAFHEAAHAIDGSTGFLLSGGSFEEWFKQLSRDNPEFLEAINERKWMPGARRGGHAGDNSKEFFASLMVSLTHPEWERAVSSPDRPGFQSTYLESLERLEANLRDSGAIADQAPIFTELANKQGVLRRATAATRDNKIHAFRERAAILDQEYEDVYKRAAAIKSGRNGFDQNTRGDIFAGQDSFLPRAIEDKDHYQGIKAAVLRRREQRDDLISDMRQAALESPAQRSEIIKLMGEIFENGHKLEKRAINDWAWTEKVAIDFSTELLSKKRLEADLELIDDKQDRLDDLGERRTRFNLLIESLAANSESVPSWPGETKN